MSVNIVQSKGRIITCMLEWQTVILADDWNCYSMMIEVTCEPFIAIEGSFQ
jgi:hypothetical protein